MPVDFILGGRGFGGIAQTLLENDMDYNILRPYKGRDGKSYVTQNVGTVEEPKWKAVRTDNTALLTRDAWLRIDEAVVKAAKPALRAVGDLRAAGLTLDVDGMATPVLMYQTMSDITGATVSMKGLREGEKDRPEFDQVFLPLPIIHKDLSFDARMLQAAKRGGFMVDMASVDLASRRVAEEAESLLIGNSASYYYGGGTVYGYRNYPGRVTKVLTNPTAAGWTPQTTFAEVLDMRQSLVNKFRPGPYMLYVSSDWDIVLDSDYSDVYPGPSLRTRLQGIDRISGVRTLDYLTGYQMILVQMSSDTVREVIGMDIRVVQWQEKGGMELFFKVMAILVPQIRTDIDGNCGIAHGTAP